jgi:phosphatidylglycerol:prolipoprotein diacylglycerol transferase
MDPDCAQAFVWNVDPVLFWIGDRPIRSYSISFFLGFVLGYFVWHWQMLRGGHDETPTSRVLLWGFVSVLVCARLAHCLLYDPEFYLRHPLEILNLSRGGIASHGATVGIFVGLFLYVKRYDFSFLEVADRASMGIAVGAVMIRLGNLFNSEIVGREWCGPWAVRFPRFAARSQAEWESVNGPLGWQALALPRHPAMLYEAFGLLAILALLFAIDRRLGEGRPRGLLAGVFCSLYFSERIAIEFFKEFLRFRELVPDPVEQVLRVVPTSGATLGQLLSLPFLAVGVGIAAWSLRARLPASRPSRTDQPPQAA